MIEMKASNKVTRVFMWQIILSGDTVYVMGNIRCILVAEYCLDVVLCEIVCEIESTPCLKKQAKLFLLSLRQTFIKADNFWHNDGKLSKIIWGVLIFHLN